MDPDKRKVLAAKAAPLALSKGLTVEQVVRSVRASWEMASRQLSEADRKKAAAELEQHFIDLGVN